MNAVDDWIATLIDRLAEAGRDSPDCDTPAERRSIACSVAVARTVACGSADWDALISTSINWAGGDTPAGMAGFILEEFPAHAPRLAELADAVAGHIEASAADLLDGGATVAEWRTYARLLRAGAS